MYQSVSHIIDKTRISRVQFQAIIICISLNALDGFDVLAISFASPGIAQEWGINRAELGIVLAMELIGMAIGSVLLGGTADKYGRKPTIQICLVLMTVGMFGSAMMTSVAGLLAFRFITGLGIGGMLAATNAMVAEFSNAKYRNLCVIVMATGYPIGAILGGSIASVLLQSYSWHAVFYFGGIVTGLFILIVAFALPESPVYLSNKGDSGCLEKINGLLTRMGKPVIQALEKRSAPTTKLPFKVLFTGDLKRVTCLLVVAYFAQIMTFYFILKWIPKIVVDMGFDPSQAGLVLVWANVGGATGAILLGLLTSKVDLRMLLLPFLFMAFVMVAVFGRGYESLGALALVSAATGFFTNSCVVGLYGLMAQKFPAQVRASGTGVVIGCGRGGAALSPIIAGFLFSHDVSLQGVALVMGTGSLVALVAIFCLGGKRRSCAENSHLSSPAK